MADSPDSFNSFTTRGAPLLTSSRPSSDGADGDRGAGAAPGTAEPAFPRAVMPSDVPPDAGLDHPHLFFNQELSWIDFNWRVIAQALDDALPALERARYLAIGQSNLDEFFAKRVGGLKRQQQAGVTQLSPDGRTPAQQLARIREAVLEMQSALSSAWERVVRPACEEQAGVRILTWDRLSEKQRAHVHAQFRATVYPILTPLAVDPTHPFPFISNLSHSLAVVLRHPAHGTEHFARVKIPTRQMRWIPLGSAGHFIAIEDVVRACAGELFPGMEVLGTYLFRVTRNADMARAEEEAADLVQMISEELRQRRFAPVVRLEIEAGTPPSVSDLLRRELEVMKADEYFIDGLQDLSGLSALANLDLPQHRFEAWDPVVPGQLCSSTGDAVDIFETLRSGDLLVHHPYDSFTGSVEHFIEAAATDPSVLAIKQTMYRTSEDSPIMRTLMRAAERGKQVAVLVEVTASYDEERNIGWAEQLEDSGAHVIYGVPGLKTHAKVTLVVRDEPTGIRTYCHIGTGNYHPATARVYTDVGLLTASEDVGRDVVNLFHSVTGYSVSANYQRLIVAPMAMRSTFKGLIEREIEIQQSGGQGCIVAKMNAIDDVELIQTLYRASQAGVSIDLIVRGHTRLRPGLPGMSDNIRLRSILGRFLEHDRVFLFGNGHAPRVFTGSADWRWRNLEGRVETVVEITDAKLVNRIDSVLRRALADNSTAWELSPYGRYTRRRPAPGEAVRSYQQELMADARSRRAAIDELARI
ncbi:polyphosphate kinase 1 [soil metagenome]